MTLYRRIELADGHVKYDPVDDEIERLRAALEKSVSLQSHYAKLLNDYDGGLRLQFSDADDWLGRLDYLAKRGVSQQTAIADEK